VKCDSVEKWRSYRLFNITAYGFFNVIVQRNQLTVARTYIGSPCTSYHSMAQAQILNTHSGYTNAIFDRKRNLLTNYASLDNLICCVFQNKKIVRKLNSRYKLELFTFSPVFLSPHQRRWGMWQIIGKKFALAPPALLDVPYGISAVDSLTVRIWFTQGWADLNQVI